MAGKPSRTRRTWIIVVVLVIVGIVALLIGLAARPSNNLSANYILQTVSRGTVTASASASGQLVDEYTYSVAPGATAVLTQRDGVAVGSAGSGSSSGGAAAGASSATGGGASGASTGGASASGYRTTELDVNVGDRVSAGQKIAKAASDLDKTDLSTAVSNAEASLNNAYEALSQDRSSYDSEKKSPTATTQSNNALQKQISSDYVAINTAQTSVTTAKENLADASVTVKSPVDGHIRSVTTAVDASASQVATIGAGATVVSVMVSEYDIARVQPKQSVQVTLGATKTEFAGTVSSIAQIPDDSSGVQQYQVVIAPTSLPAGTRIGMTVTASIAIESRSDVIAVPATAVTTTDGHSVVSVVNSRGALVVTPVKLGLVGDTSVEIDSGLKIGQRIVSGSNGTVPVVSTVTRPGGGS